MLSRDNRWSALYSEISLEEFAKEKVPAIRFKKEVNQEVKGVFRIIHKLLVLAYYEYEFWDLATLKALHTFEMALKLRYQELNGGAEWKKGATLEQLLEWFRQKNLFEYDNTEFLNHVRNTRNYLTHPKGHNFGGIASIHWVSTTVDLINDIYEDVGKRLKRRKLREDLLARLNKFLDNGAVFRNNDDSNTLIYSSGAVMVNNLAEQIKYYFWVLPVFDKQSTLLRSPASFEVAEDKLEFLQLGQLQLSDQNGNPLILTNNLTEDERVLINKFREAMSTDEGLRIMQVGQFHDCHEQMLKLWRWARFEHEDNLVVE